MFETAAPTADLNATLRDEASKLGLDAIGVARLATTASLPRDWRISSARAATATWTGWRRMPTGAAIRVGYGRKPKARSSSANPTHRHPIRSTHFGQRDHGIVSVYAKGRDYHEIMKKKIKSLARAFASERPAPKSKSSSIPRR